MEDYERPYLLLFLGTPYMTSCENEERAHEVKEYVMELYPHIRFAVVQMIEPSEVRVTDDIFWGFHRGEIEQFNHDVEVEKYGLHVFEEEDSGVTRH